MEEFLTINQYKKRYHIGDIKVKEMIATGELKTKGKKIVVQKDFVPLADYITVIAERELYKTQLEAIKKIIGG